MRSIYLLNVVVKQEILIKTQKTKPVTCYRVGDVIGLQILNSVAFNKLVPAGLALSTT